VVLSMDVWGLAGTWPMRNWASIAAFIVSLSIVFSCCEWFTEFPSAPRLPRLAWRCANSPPQWQCTIQFPSPLAPAAGPAQWSPGHQTVESGHPTDRARPVGQDARGRLAQDRGTGAQRGAFEGFEGGGPVRCQQFFGRREEGKFSKYAQVGCHQNPQKEALAHCSGQAWEENF